ncbi:MAG: hypothetical protein JOZ81_06110 [Chloroflexi bacterium]|nr:hypothetical protein [Chloroflexota bacterium]
MAGYNQAVVSVPGPSQPSVKAAAAILSNCSTVYTAVIVHMVQCEKLERTLTATHAPDLAVAVVPQRGESILAKPRDPVLVVAVSAP